MTTITQNSNPELWSLLYNKYVEEGQPRNVIVGSIMYEIVLTTTYEYEFNSIENLKYIDSRSIKGSRGASYSNLSE